jgi:hypothetical protein
MTIDLESKRAWAKKKEYKLVETEEQYRSAVIVVWTLFASLLLIIAAALIR